MVSEAWIVTQPEAQELEVAPRQHPNRKEAIALVGRDAQNSSLVFAIQPFQRDDENQLVFDPVELEHFSDTPNPQYCATGLFDHLFPQGNFH